MGIGAEEKVFSFDGEGHLYCENCGGYGEFKELNVRTVISSLDGVGCRTITEKEFAGLIPQPSEARSMWEAEVVQEACRER